MKRLRELLYKGAELVAAALFAAMFGTFLLQVFMRYVFNLPLQWSLEFDLVVYIWIVFWAAAFLVRGRDHIAFNLVYDGSPPAARRVMGILGGLIVAATFIVALPATYDFVSFMAIESTPVVRWRFDIVFSIFVVFVVAIILRSLRLLWRLVGRDWRRHI
ncbi:MAG: TRAP transporter small permease [Alphaproteobacteria bacterium]